MPHDHSGNELKVGDRVHIECVVASVSPGTDFCNVTVETAHGRKPDNQVQTITLNAHQVDKCDHAPPTPCPVNPTVAGVALAVLALLLGAGPAAAQVPPQAPPIVDRVAALEKKVADLEARLAKAGQVSAAACPCGDSCPCATRTTTAAPAALTYPAYTPAYGYGQPVYGYSASPAYGSSFGSGGGSCAGGSCSMPSSGGGFFRRR
jgi:hypothetical protein